MLEEKMQDIIDFVVFEEETSLHYSMEAEQQANFCTRRTNCSTAAGGLYNR